MGLRTLVALLAILPVFSSAHAEEQLNIVLILMDIFGWGELGTYGGGVLRGAPTPHAVY